MRRGLPGTPQNAPTREWCYGRQNFTVSRIAYALVSGQIAYDYFFTRPLKSQLDE